MTDSIHYKTIIVSDIHLGTKGSKAKELVRFLRKNPCEKLILNGDIIDFWQLKKNGKWKKKHTRFFKIVIKMMQKFNTEVIYLRGNHDDLLDNIMPFSIGNLSILPDYYLYSNNKKFWVVHGDIFDSVTTNMKWLAKLGDVGYTFLLWLNKMYNNRRLRKGLPYFSLSQLIKQKVKSAVSYISDFEKELVSLARQRGCDGVICGHIHHPEISNYNGLIYMNSGDWVESLSALAEHPDGRWEIVYYTDFTRQEQPWKDLIKEEKNNKE